VQIIYLAVLTINSNFKHGSELFAQRQLPVKIRAQAFWLRSRLPLETKTIKCEYLLPSVVDNICRTMRDSCRRNSGSLTMIGSLSFARYGVTLRMWLKYCFQLSCTPNGLDSSNTDSRKCVESRRDPIWAYMMLYQLTLPVIMVPARSFT